MAICHLSLAPYSTDGRTVNIWHLFPSITRSLSLSLSIYLSRLILLWPGLFGQVGHLASAGLVGLGVDKSNVGSIPSQQTPGLTPTLSTWSHAPLSVQISTHVRSKAQSLFQPAQPGPAPSLHTGQAGRHRPPPSSPPLSPDPMNPTPVQYLSSHVVCV